MTIGTVTYSPQGVFSFNRAYITHLDLYTNVDNYPSLHTNEIRVNSFSFPNIVQYIILKPQVIPWSSNAYTLGWIVDEWYYQTSPFGTHIPYGGLVKFRWSADTQSRVMMIQTDSPDHHTYFQLAGAPPGYWMPPYL